MRCNYESIARWNRHYADMSRRADERLAQIIREHAAAIRAAGLTADFGDYYAWTSSNPTARAERQSIYDRHGTAREARAAWSEVFNERG